MNSYSRVYASIDLDAVESNMRAMKDSLPPSASMIGVVKTDGYGHGAVPVARAIDPYVKGYAVATIDEAIILRRHGIQKMILVLGVTHESRFEDLVRYDIRPAMFRCEEAGMSRIGMTPDEASADEAARISRLPGICIEGMFTHFARADEADKAFYEAQYKKYREFCEMLCSRGVDIPIRHCSNSAGIVEGLDSNGLDMVRAGISIYGLYPSDEVARDRVKLVPAMELKSFITYIKTIGPGTAVSYGGTFVADRPMRVATIPVGYGDGYLRSLSNKGAVLIRGKRAEILGRICMDQFMADVTDIPEAEEGDQVTLIGRDGEECITVEELAALSGGFHYEIICQIGKRVPRVYLRDGKAIGKKDYFNDIYEGFGYM